MNYQKVREVLKNEGLLDDSNLVCRSTSNYIGSSYHFIYSEFKTEKQKWLPKFMLISICNGDLIISEAKASGKFKGFFGKIPFKALTFNNKETNGIQDVYRFNTTSEDGKKGDFNIVASGDDSWYAQRIVEYIQEYQKKETK